ncbi:hypothetical protein [Lutibacter sp.]
MTLYKKIKNRLWGIVVARFRKYNFYPKLYKAYWHFYFNTSKNKKIAETNYFSAIPNPGAGIGHQMANWIAGYWYAQQFGLNFAHIPFSTQQWGNFLGFGDNEIMVAELINKKGYKKVRLPLFNENNFKQIELIKKIIQSYAGNKVVFIAEQDQFYSNQFGVIQNIKQKFHHAVARKKMKLVFNQDYFNIAIHVRRGDITIGQETKNQNLLMRWQNNEYFEKVLTAVVKNLKTAKPIAIYLFSQGKKQDFKEFKKFKNIHYCLDMSAQDSFEHMVYTDLLITSKSSFSYKPALLSNGLKICPSNFWHGYPKTKDWILADEEGVFDVNQLS